MSRFILLIKKFKLIITIIKKKLLILIRKFVTILLLYKQKMLQHLKLKNLISNRYKKIKKILLEMYKIQGFIFKIKSFNTQNKPNFMFIGY